MADTFSKVKTIIVDLLGVDESQITPYSRFRDDLEADSLDLVELVMAFEDEFDKEISDDDAQMITTVGEAVAYIDRRLGRVSTPPLARIYTPPATQSINVRPSQPYQVERNQFRLDTLTNNSVFISYSRSDWGKYVEPLIQRLRSEGISVWVDQHLIEGGSDWQDEINLALKTCNRMILCVTPKALSSRFVKMEYRYFFNHAKKLIPVLCKKADLPAELQGIQYTSYNDFSRLLSLL